MQLLADIEFPDYDDSYAPYGYAWYNAHSKEVTIPLSNTNNISYQYIILVVGRPYGHGQIGLTEVTLKK
jgi:hypothetical protein